jgi:hypothetical protein
MEDDGDGALVGESEGGEVVDAQRSIGRGELAENEELSAADADFILCGGRGEAEGLDEVADGIEDRGGSVGGRRRRT